MSDLDTVPSDGGEDGNFRSYAAPWPRLWARLLDTSIYIGVIALVVGIFLPEFFSRDVFEGRAGSQLIGLVLLPFALIMDSIVVVVFGNSLGKALVGLRLETLQNRRLNFSTAAKRNLGVYLQGLGLGIPIVSLVQYSMNFSKLKEGKQTNWDQANFTRVFDVANTFPRTVIAAIAYFCIFVGSTALDVMSEDNIKDSEISSKSGVHNRTDPVELQLKRAAEQLKPQQIDEVTRLNGAVVKGRTFTYLYTITRRDVKDSYLVKFLNDSIEKKVCNNKDMRSDLDDFSIVYRYSYELPDRDKPILIDVDSRRCSLIAKQR